MSDVDEAAERLFSGPGEMRARARARDWAATPLGPVAGWSTTLRAVVPLVMASGFPSALLWGSELTFVYNDAYIPLIGAQHPSVLGRRLFDAAPETRETFEPLLRRVLAGETVSVADVPTTFRRADLDAPATTSVYTFSFAPVCDPGDPAGVASGIHVIVVETTAQVALRAAEAKLRAVAARQTFLLALSDALRPLADPTAVQEAAMRLLGRHLGVDRAFYYEVLPEGDTVEAGVGYLDGVPGLPRRLRLPDFGDDVVADYRAGRTVVVGDAQADATHTPIQQAAYAAIQTRAAIGVPLVKHGRFVAALGVHQRVPRAWTAEEIALVEEAAERTWDAVERARAEAALRASEARAAAIVAQLPGAAVFIVDADLCYTLAEGEALRAAGFTPADFVGHALRDALPAELADAYESNYRRVQAGETFATEHEAHGRVWVSRGAPLRDAEGRVVAALAVSYDVTERRLTELALAESEARFRAVANLVPDLLWESDPSGSTAWYNDRWWAYTGRPPAETIGWGWVDAIHPDDRERSRADYAAAVAEGRALQLLERIRRADGAYRWFLVRAEPLRDDAGHVVRWFGAATDVHDERVAREAAEAARATIERRVAERTGELARANARLEAEVAARARAQAERNALLQRLAAAQEAERRHLARELHDEVGQHLTAVGLGLKALGDVVPRGSEVDRRVEGLRALVDTLGRELHALAVQLRPKALDDFGLEAAVATYAEAWSRRHGVAVVVHARVDAERFTPAVESAVYRIVQEALTNVARHSGATRAGVIVERLDGTVVVTVEDDGRGFDPESAAGNRGDAAAGSSAGQTVGGLGLLGIRERATVLGGSVDIESSPGQGTTLFVRIPIEPPAEVIDDLASASSPSTSDPSTEGRPIPDVHA